MLYRSPLTRWVLALTGLVAGLILVFGDPSKWRSTPSIHWLSQAPIPLQAWGVAFIVYAVLLVASADTRPVGYAVGAGLFAIFTISLLATLSDGGPKNIITIAAMTDTVIFHIYSIRTAMAVKLAT